MKTFTSARILRRETGFMLRRLIFAGSVLITALGVLAIAQGPRDGERGPGPRGFGGPFGGPFGGRPPLSNVLLLGMPEVRREIGVTEKQQPAIDELLRESQERQQEAFGQFNFQELRDLEPEEREGRVTEFRKSLEESSQKLDEKLAKILDAKQSERLSQLRLQREGIGALARPEIVKALGLSEKQQDQLRGRPPEFGPFGPDPELARRAESEALAILTKEQQEKWSQMKGKEFAFAQFGGPGGPGGFGGPGGPGGFGGPPGGQERQIVKQFDKDGDGRLNADERKAARDFLKTDGGGRGRGPGGFGGGPGGRGGRGRGGPGGPGGPGGGPGGFGRRNEEPKPGPKVQPSEVASFPDVPLYDEGILRTLFLDFEDADWEQQMADFNNTDVEVPATLVVDGKTYPNVGVHFRGMSSFFTVGEGSKRSLNLSLDFVDEKQRLNGYKTLNLLNSHEDPSFLHTVLYLHVAREYIPAPKANFVKVVINGESWGVYVSAQQFNKEFLADNYPSAKGTRWKVQGSPGGRGGLEYIGDNIEEYKRRYTMKTDDGEKAWKALIALCRTLNETPPEQLEAALEPILDIDGALWFLALENALINSDGYWIRASDYCIFRDSQGKFHVIPHDANETFQPGMGPGFGGPGGFAGGPGGFGGRGGRGAGGPPGAGPEGGPGAGRPEQGGPPGDRRRGGPGGFGGGGGGRSGNGIEVDPLVGLNDPTKPLRTKLLAVPALKTRYLQHVRTIAEKWLDWKNLEPLVAKYEALIDKEIEADTRKLTSYREFKESLGREEARSEGERRRRPNLRQFAEQRRAYLLNHPEIKALGE